MKENLADVLGEKPLTKILSSWRVSILLTEKGVPIGGGGGITLLRIFSKMIVCELMLVCELDSIGSMPILSEPQH